MRFNLQVTGLGQKTEVLRMDAFSYLERTADREFAYAFIAPPQYKGLCKRALLSLDEHPEWLTKDSSVVAQIYPVEYEALSLRNLAEFEQRHYGSVLFVFYERHSLTKKGE